MMVDLNDYNLDQKLNAQIKDILPLLRESNSRLTKRLEKQTKIQETLEEALKNG